MPMTVLAAVPRSVWKQGVVTITVALFCVVFAFGQAKGRNREDGGTDTIETLKDLVDARDVTKVEIRCVVVSNGKLTTVTKVFDRKETLKPLMAILRKGKKIDEPPKYDTDARQYFRVHRNLNQIEIQIFSPPKFISIKNQNYYEIDIDQILNLSEGPPTGST